MITKLTNIELGRYGEWLAERYLIKKGVSIIRRNIRTNYGEIDILGKQNGILIFIEVKTRRSQSFGNPEGAVNEIKKEHMINSALEYIQLQSDGEVDWRIDVIAINIDKKDKIQIEWFKNAVTC